MGTGGWGCWKEEPWKRSALAEGNDITFWMGIICTVLHRDRTGASVFFLFGMFISLEDRAVFRGKGGLDLG